MKKILYLILLCVVLTNCKKKGNEPESDSYSSADETQTAKDLHQMMATITDINLIAGYFLDSEVLKAAYFDVVAGSSGTVKFVRNISPKTVLVTFNNAFCEDGKIRNGSILFNFSQNNEFFYKNFSFACEILQVDYVVDGWKIELFYPNIPVNIINTLTSDRYDPLVMDISWELSGKFRLTRMSDNKQISWEGKLTEILDNTENPEVFPPVKLLPIEWNKAVVRFYGSGSGNVGGENYTMEIGEGTSMIKDFSCSFTPSGTSATQFHPYVSGIASFSLANHHPITINYGPTSACDNVTTVKSKDKSYTMPLN